MMCIGIACVSNMWQQNMQHVTNYEATIIHVHLPTTLHHLSTIGVWMSCSWNELKDKRGAMEGTVHMTTLFLVIERHTH